MRKVLIIIATALCLSSCAITNNSYYSKTHYFGDVALLNNNGDTLRQWKQAIIGYENTGAYQNDKSWFLGNDYGTNFIDNQGKSIYLRGGIVIVDNVRKATDTKAFKVYTSSEKADIAEFEKKYNVLKLNVAECDKQLRQTNDNEYKAFKAEQIQGLSRQMDEIKEYLQRTYNYKID